MASVFKPSVQAVIRSQYFLYFGVMGVFLPYFNLYCYHLGFSGFQIGSISAAKSLTMIILPLVWAGLADRYQIRRPIYLICNMASSVIWAFFLLTTDFSYMLAIIIAYGIFHAPIISFLEAFTMDTLGKEKNKYGQVRLWGSIAFITVALVMGRIIDMSAINIIIACIFVGSLIQAFIAVKMPNIKHKKTRLNLSDVSILLTPRIIVFLGCAFLMIVSHGAYYGFFSIYLARLGYGNAFIGFVWALASMAEIGVMMYSNRLFKRFSLVNILVFAFMAAAVRWVMLMHAQFVWLLLTAQILHAITYGAFHMASILYIDAFMPANGKTLGQAVNNAATYGLGLMVGFMLNGYLYEHVDMQMMFLFSGLVALGSGLLFKGFHMVGTPR
jgi:PPP family 3-phenylpropionic acid transporter